VHAMASKFDLQVCSALASKLRNKQIVKQRQRLQLSAACFCMLNESITWMSEMLLEMSGPLEPPNTGNSAFVPNCSCASQTSSKSLRSGKRMYHNKALKWQV